MKKPIMSEGLKKVILWGAIAFLYLVFTVSGFILPFLFGLLIVWLYQSKGEQVNFNAIKDYKNQKLRIVLTFCLIITTYYFSSSFKHQQFVENYPTPQIYVLSSQESQGNATEYLLELEAEEYTSIRINNRLLQADTNGKLQTTIPLDHPKTTIKIDAKNDYKASTKNLVISRNETEEEKAERLAREEEAKIRAEEAEKQRLAEAERQKEIERQAEMEHKEIEKNGLMGDLEKMRDEIKNFQTLYVEKGGYDSIASLTAVAGQFGLWQEAVLKAQTSEFEDFKALGEQIGSELSALQTREFPKMRKAYGEIADTELWKHDVDVKVFGTANATIELIGYHFALNANIADSHQELREMLILLRFDRANYKSSEYGEYTYFTLKSKADWEI